MPVTIKNKEHIRCMMLAGEILAECEQLLKDAIRPGVTTLQLDKIAEDFIRSRGAVPSFKGYGGFPGTLCTSVNEQIVHGIPGTRRLVEGDIISIDMGCYIQGFHADMARTYGVGEISPLAEKLIRVTEESFFEGIAFAKAGHHLNEIGQAIQKYVEANGFSVVREYVGHGIGRALHEDPAVHNYKVPGRGLLLEAGMALAIEPMVNAGGCGLRLLQDGWTAVTKDGSLSAHYENTVVITDENPILTTMPKSGIM